MRNWLWVLPFLAAALVVLGIGLILLAKLSASVGVALVQI